MKSILLIFYLSLLTLIISQKIKIVKTEDFKYTDMRLDCNHPWDSSDSYEVYEYYNAKDNLNLDILIYKSPLPSQNVSLFYYYSEFQMTRENISSLVVFNGYDLSGNIIYSEPIMRNDDDYPIEIIFNKTNDKSYLKKGYYYLAPICHIPYDKNDKNYLTGIQVQDIENQKIELEIIKSSIWKYSTNININLFNNLEFEFYIENWSYLNIKTVLYEKNIKPELNIMIFENNETQPVFSRGYDKISSYLYELKNNSFYRIKFESQINQSDNKQIYQSIGLCMSQLVETFIPELQIETQKIVHTVSPDSYYYIFNISNFEIGDKILIYLSKKYELFHIFYKEIDSNDKNFIIKKVFNDDSTYIELNYNKNQKGKEAKDFYLYNIKTKSKYVIFLIKPIG